ncbi:MAG: PKD domain-containing protein, partial [Cyclobacteriaceae bacterium]
MSNKILNKIWFVLAAVLLISISSCNDDEQEMGPDPIASFQFEIDADNFRQVQFTNFSQNATTYSWDFGDSQTSTEENPVHEYADAGTYTVTLTATNDEEIAISKSEEVIITDPLSAERALIGDNGKTWMLLADASTGVNTFQVGPDTRSEVWWSLGTVEELCVRECLFDDTWTFNTDGTYTFDNNGSFWGEGGVWAEELVGCFDATDVSNFLGANGQDLSGWNSGTHPFTYDPSTATLIVNGGFVGLSKAGTNAEVTEPQTSVTYTVVKLVESTVDTLVLETTIDGGYWAATLVSYNDQAPVIVEECEAVESVDVTFRLNFNDYAGSAVNPEVNGTFNNWCGNCNPMTDEDGDGIWETTLNLPVGDHEFKFSADNWADQESLSEGDACTTTNGEGNTNRTLTVGQENMTVGP